MNCFGCLDRTIWPRSLVLGDINVFLFYSYGFNLAQDVVVIFRLAARLEEIEFDVSLVTTEWFLCLFAKSLPSEVCCQTDPRYAL